jgi:hypothetical protein
MRPWPNMPVSALAPLVLSVDFSFAISATCRIGFHLVADLPPAPRPQGCGRADLRRRVQVVVVVLLRLSSGSPAASELAHHALRRDGGGMFT